MRRLALVLGFTSLLAQDRGSLRAQEVAGAAQLASPLPPATTLPASNDAQPQPFEEWLALLRAEALDRGFDEQVVRQLDGLQPLQRVIAADRSQAELNPGFTRYLSSRVTPVMVRRGQEHARANRRLLGRVETRFDVQRQFLLAIWGLETRYGRVTGNTPVLRALATLAWEPRRSAYFRGELFDALTMVSMRHIEAPTMTGSWAGAMGQTQFMPSSYLKHAVDFDRDGRSDIWRNTGDALASIANYLKAYGWNNAYTWGREVAMNEEVRARVAERVPRRTEGCFARRNMTERIPLDEWRAMGVTREDGGALPHSDVPAGLVDVGERQFLVYPNYDAILGYNCAHYYALSVALLADRLK